MVSEGGSLERDFGIPVSDSASVVSTGMASECSLQALHPVSLLSGRECFLSQVFFSSLPIPLLHHFFLSILGGLKRLPPTPAPFVRGEAERQGLSLSLEQADGTGAAVRDTVPHLHGAR